MPRQQINWVRIWSIIIAIIAGTVIASGIAVVCVVKSQMIDDDAKWLHSEKINVGIILIAAGIFFAMFAYAILFDPTYGTPKEFPYPLFLIATIIAIIGCCVTLVMYEKDEKIYYQQDGITISGRKSFGYNVILLITNDRDQDIIAVLSTRDYTAKRITIHPGETYKTRAKIFYRLSIYAKDDKIPLIDRELYYLRGGES